MAAITEDLLRKCAEHNDCEIFSLEEVSLHQRNIKKIEHIDRWCRDLKILYLHSNLISKIENLSRLKKLEYVNFTLNNITRIENLEGCESLRKLDFTANFIGELTSIESLRDNYQLEELYLTGNPCTEFEGYREFVIATLPQLMILDGEKIKKSERIVALQKYNRIRSEILEQEKLFLKHRQYNTEDIKEELENNWDDLEKCDEESQSNFWKQQTKNTPQSRIEICKHMEKSRKKTNSETKKPKLVRKLITDDGKILNVNEPKLDFEFTDDEENNCYKLDLAVFRFLDTSLLEVDVQPNYVRVKVKEKYFQLLLPGEVHPDMSTCLRSQTTGHLVITMPKASDVLIGRKGLKNSHDNRNNQEKKRNISEKHDLCVNNEETQQSIMSSIDKIVDMEANQNKKLISCVKDQEEIFIDNPDVPPLL
ncbi:dynein axonemal assembly factor 11-like [Argiope bruennichi]|uniref:dynein axonemal assembly factor 11-like n=1 Tax=Argiope bruennichi TaxID=94029 RepID=UPI0024950C3C|nr:dynein axonemal assembly factor 11-like [Argiope bruennichi]